MKRTVIAAFLVALVTVAPLLPVAAGAETAPKGEFAQMKDARVKRLEERIAVLQKEMSCVQEASRYEELQACRDKARDELKKLRDDQ
jgi:hypothetical protein